MNVPIMGVCRWPAAKLSPAASGQSFVGRWTKRPNDSARPGDATPNSKQTESGWYRETDERFLYILASERHFSSDATVGGLPESGSLHEKEKVPDYWS